MKIQMKLIHGEKESKMSKYLISVKRNFINSRSVLTGTDKASLQRTFRKIKK